MLASAVHFTPYASMYMSMYVQYTVLHAVNDSKQSHGWPERCDTKVCARLTYSSSFAVFRRTYNIDRAEIQPLVYR